MQVRRLLSLATFVLIGLMASAAQANNLLISEIFFNPPGGDDEATGLEYIELCGLPSTPLDNHYMIFLENENDFFNSGNPGQIENVFNLNGMSLGSNGFAVLAMRLPFNPGNPTQVDNPYPVLDGPYDIAVAANPAAPTVAESLKTLPNGAHAYVNRDTGAGFGNGVTSSIGHVGESSNLEGSGFTAMLIEVDPLAGGVAPSLGADLDVGNDGLDNPNGQTGWTILDSIGVFGEDDEPDFGRLYAENNFGPGAAFGPPGGSSGTYVNTWPTDPTFPPGLQEIEYVGRVGDGQDIDDWMATNLTDNAASGFSAALQNYGISGQHATETFPEVYVGTDGSPAEFPYGTDITVTFGEANVGFEGSHTVPEPSSVVLLGLGSIGIAVVSYRRYRAG